MKLKIGMMASALGFVIAQSAYAVILPGPLVTPQWLKDHQGEVAVVDVRDNLTSFTTKPRFEPDPKSGKKTLVQVGGHIPGALSVDFAKIREERIVNGLAIKAQLPTAEHFQQVMDSAGLNKADKPIVIVATGESVEAMDMATRLYFQLRYFGEPPENVAILNGGLAGWLQEGYLLTTENAPSAKGNWITTGEDKGILASIDQVKEGVAKGAYQFVDARPTPQFLSITKNPVNKAAGHLPGARSFPTDAVVRSKGAAREFLSADEYKKIYANLNINAGSPTVSYCNTGHLASGTWFVQHEILGNKDARLYAGSMIEWTNLDNPTVGQ